ncbi:MAG TPA: AAA family ATPase [Gaiellaceae bacterium]|nr:AAA family ATPase [Gaiellaceae bacterium]
MVSAAAARKTVSVLFCDLADSTALGEQLDPEPLREVMGSWYEAMREAVERHGGTVEKFVGDAVMAVFGLPRAHEDDALRAVRAALDMHEEVERLNVSLAERGLPGLRTRIGINTGEVVTGAEVATLATGDAVNTAKRLEQAAGGGEILIGAMTERLVRHAARLEPVGTVDAKGKTNPVEAWRVHLLETEEGAALHPQPRFVGRARELELLEEAWERVRADRRCGLVTILGEPGIGKSRLVSELAARIEGRVVSGRCLSYGDGITYWPVLEVLRQLGTLPAQPDAARALRSLLGDVSEPSTAEEIAWGFRQLLEERARETPLLCVFDDLQWAEETFLDLLEHLALLSRDAPILLLCMARPELGERRAGWPVALRLQPLEAEPVAELIPDALPQALRDKIAHSAAGNPLFLIEMTALAREGDGELSVPASLRALLGARLDQLSPEERRLLQCASVEGEIFHRGSLLALSPEEAQLTPRLASLVRKELLYPAEAQLPGEDAFRFRHILLRDAAYATLPKADRASLHERFAAWAEQRSGEFEELLGYHLEQAVRYRRELGTFSEPVQAERASEFLGTAGRRALSRGDMPAAVDLLSRAASLLPESADERLDLVPELGAALRETGELTRADEILSEAIEAGRSSGNRRIELAALIERAALRLVSEPEDDADLKEVGASIPALEEFGDDHALAAAWSLIGRREGLWKGRFAQGEEALERALTHARRLGDRRQEALILGQLALSALSGPTPVHEAIARCRRLVAEAGGDRLVEANVARYLAVLEAMRGNFADATTLVGEARAAYEDLGMRLMAQSAISLAHGAIGLLAADYRAAGIELRAGLDALEGMGERGYYSSVAAFLAQALYGDGRLDEADDVARRALASAAPDDLWSQVLSRGTRAKVCASRGAHEEAERQAREAVGRAAATDALDLHGNALIDLADTLALAGRNEEADECVAEALRLYERKGNDVSAERARARLAGESVTAAEGPGGRAS